ncbi:capsid and scaffold protein [Enterococcus phage PEf771]|uniref:Capsid and scaffold protein n=1 Tax=Enterococcus phage PEf771 TaxID=2601638 RepID=A0A6H1NPV6_9CAUD|nr:capsid and scaffold protein [Enterococcus phage PEf771]
MVYYTCKQGKHLFGRTQKKSIKNLVKTIDKKK